MFYTGRIVDGRFYLGTYWGYKEVSEKIYYEYMRLQWREWKTRERESHLKAGRPISIEQLYEDNEFDIEDRGRRSVEDTVILKLMIEDLYRAIDRLDPDDQFLIWALFLKEEPMTQEQLARDLGVSQKTISKTKDKILKILREAMKDWED